MHRIIGLMGIVVGEWFYTLGDCALGATEGRLLVHYFTSLSLGLMSLVVGEWLYTLGDWVLGSTEGMLLLHYFTTSLVT